MNARQLTKEDLWYSVLGGAAMATGGGGQAPSYEVFSQAVDPVYSAGLKPNLIDVEDVPDDGNILAPFGIGGSIPREDQERYGPPLRPGPYIDIAFNEMDRVYPLLQGVKYNEAWREVAIQRLKDLKGETKYVAHVAGEIGPGVYREALSSAKEGISVVNADLTGGRAVPEMSFICLNVKNRPANPAVIATFWGDVLVCEKAISWQRLEDLSRAVALVSGGFNSTVMSFKGKEIKETAVRGTYSQTIKIGKAIQVAKESNSDPVEAIVGTWGGYKLFEGEIVTRTLEGKFAFIWGNIWIKGSGKYEGKLLRIWYKNENQISWLDGEPYATCPDPFTVIDSKTGEGLSNFRNDSWTPGRKVAVVGARAADIWRTERGIQIFCPRHFGFDIKYKPIEKIVA